MSSSAQTTILITANGKAVKARLIESPTSRDLIQLLPLTLKMNDLFNREKFGHLPRALSKGGKATYRYTVGEIAYWPPGPDIAVFYRHDGEAIPEPGIIVLGKVTSGLEAFHVPGSLTVRLELVDASAAGSDQSTSAKASGDHP